MKQIYKAEGETLYASEVGTGRFTIGGSSSSLFLPNVNASYWHSGKDEYAREFHFLNINRDVPGGSVVHDSEEDKLTLDTGADTYDKFFFNDFGHLEWDTILRVKPASRVIRYRIKAHPNLRFGYQDTLENEYKLNNEGFGSVEDYLATCHRPPDVEGSYAIYCDLHGEYRRNGETIFAPRSGKVGHFYRPMLRDSDGKWSWGKITISPFGVEPGDYYLDVEIPQEFYDSAVYPVTVDPVLGSEICGASGTTSPRGRPYTSGTDGDFTDIGICAHNTSGAVTGTVTGSIYKDEGGGNDTKLLGEATSKTYATSEDECSGTGSTFGYVVADHPDGSSTYWFSGAIVAGGMNLCYDSDANSVKQTVSAHPDPYDWSAAADSSFKISIWGVYDVAATGAIPLLVGGGMGQTMGSNCNLMTG